MTMKKGLTQSEQSLHRARDIWRKRLGRMKGMSMAGKIDKLIDFYGGFPVETLQDEIRREFAYYKRNQYGDAATQSAALLGAMWVAVLRQGGDAWVIPAEDEQLYRSALRKADAMGLPHPNPKGDQGKVRDAAGAALIVVPSSSSPPTPPPAAPVEREPIRKPRKRKPTPEVDRDELPIAPPPPPCRVCGGPTKHLEGGVCRRCHERAVLGDWTDSPAPVAPVSAPPAAPPEREPIRKPRKRKPKPTLGERVQAVVEPPVPQSSKQRMDDLFQPAAPAPAPVEREPVRRKVRLKPDSPILTPAERAGLDAQIQIITDEADRRAAARASVPRDEPVSVSEVIGHRRVLRLDCGHDAVIYTRPGWRDRGKEWFPSERQMRSEVAKPGRHLGFMVCPECGHESDTASPVVTERIHADQPIAPRRRTSVPRDEPVPAPEPTPRRRASVPQDEPTPRRRASVPHDEPVPAPEPTPRRRATVPRDEPQDADNASVQAVLAQLVQQMNLLREENASLRREVESMRGSGEGSQSGFFEKQLQHLNEQLNSAKEKTEQLRIIYSQLSRRSQVERGYPLPPPPPWLRDTPERREM